MGLVRPSGHSGPSGYMAEERCISSTVLVTASLFLLLAAESSDAACVGGVDMPCEFGVDECFTGLVCACWNPLANGQCGGFGAARCRPLIADPVECDADTGSCPVGRICTGREFGMGMGATDTAGTCSFVGSACPTNHPPCVDNTSYFDSEVDFSCADWAERIEDGANNDDCFKHGNHNADERTELLRNCPVACQICSTFGPTQVPTQSPGTEPPTQAPVTPRPTQAPATTRPSEAPTSIPTTSSPSPPTPFPTTSPSPLPSQPLLSNQNDAESSVSIVVVIVAIAVVLLIIAVILLICCLRYRREVTKQSGSVVNTIVAPAEKSMVLNSTFKNGSDPVYNVPDEDDDAEYSAIGPAGSQEQPMYEAIDSCGSESAPSGSSGPGYSIPQDAKPPNVSSNIAKNPSQIQYFSEVPSTENNEYALPDYSAIVDGAPPSPQYSTATKRPPDELFDKSATPLPPNWYETKDAAGTTYYYNAATQQTQWHMPTVDSNSSAEVSIPQVEGVYRDPDNADHENTTMTSDDTPAKKDMYSGSSSLGTDSSYEVVTKPSPPNPPPRPSLSQNPGAVSTVAGYSVPQDASEAIPEFRPNPQNEMYEVPLATNPDYSEGTPDARTNGTYSEGLVESSSNMKFTLFDKSEVGKITDVQML